MPVKDQKSQTFSIALDSPAFDLPCPIRYVLQPLSIGDNADAASLTPYPNSLPVLTSTYPFHRRLFWYLSGLTLRTFDLTG